MSNPLVFCRECGSSLPLSTSTTDFCCSDAEVAFKEKPNTARRIEAPMINGQIVSWDQANDAIIENINRARKKGMDQLGLYLGSKTFLRSLDWMQTILFSTRMGTKSIFTEQCLDDSARLLVTEWMLGHASPLLTDLGRAHNILIIGDNPKDVGWGTLQPDHHYWKEIAHSQQTKHTKVSFVSATPFETPVTAQSHIRIQPGTECFFLLGMVNLILTNGWYDKQFVEKYTTGISEIKHLVAPYSVSECAKICGITDADISGVTLKWTRSAMGIIHLTPGALRSENAMLGAWAWMVLHVLSANALRPGGLYESMGSVDVLPALIALRTENAPKSSVANQPLLIAQNMGSQLLQEIEQGNIDTLLIIDHPHLPQQSRLLSQIGSLQCSIVFAESESELTKLATIVLPRTTSWEEDDIALHRNNTFSTQCLPTSSVLHPSYGSARSVHSVLKTVNEALSFVWSGSELGLTNRLIAQQIIKGDIRQWCSRIWGLLHEDDLISSDSLNYKGEHDRALWRRSQDTINLFPEPLPELFQNIDLPNENESFPLRLHTSHKTKDDSEPIFDIHPDHNIPEGQAIQIQTLHGVLYGIARNNPSIHLKGVMCSASTHPEILDVLPTKTNHWCGTPIFNGVSCQIKRI